MNDQDRAYNKALEEAGSSPAYGGPYEYRGTGDKYQSRRLCKSCGRPFSPWKKCGKPPKLVVPREEVCRYCGKGTGHNIVRG
jgi:hypothetical protein